MTVRAIDRESVQILSVPSKIRPFWDVFLVWGVIAAAVAGAHLMDRPYAYLLAIVVIGARQNALATLAHEGWHSLLFPSRRLNHAAAAWLFAYPIGILYFHDRERHLRHHREIGRDYDPDWINYTSRGRETPGRVLGYLASLLCGRLLFSTVLSLVKRGKPRIGVESPNAGILGELWCIGISQALLFAVMTLATDRWWTYPLLWMLPLATFAGFFANFRALIEHVTARDDVAPENRLRDIHAGPIERFFIAPSHFNYHALHHEHPSLPHYNLPRIKAAYIQQSGSYPFKVQPGYVKALISHIRQLQAQS